MRAMLLAEQGALTSHSLKSAEAAIPEPGPKQIRLEVTYCGVCHTDLHIVEGELPASRLPLIPGHQITGRVEKLGLKVSKWRLGERVGVPWLYHTCGQCRYCLSGKENLCEQAWFTGLQANGGYAEYMVVDEDFAYALPAGIPDEQAAPLLCAGVIGYRSLRLAEISPGGRLGLFGFGASAHICLQIARHWGCEVYVFTRKPEHRRLALELGARWAGGIEDDPGIMLDAGITFAPAGGVVKEALRHLDRGGTLAVNAVHLSPIPVLPYDLLYYERTLRSVANSTRRDVREFLNLAGEIPIRTEVQLYSLEQANQALAAVKESAVNGAAVLQVAASPTIPGL
jgi:alcohol dehydrogenase, propanol-preferring